MSLLVHVRVFAHRRSARDALARRFDEMCNAIDRHCKLHADMDEKLAKGHFDLMVLDVMMPRKNGFDVAATLKTDPEYLNIPIIMLCISYAG